MSGLALQEIVRRALAEDLGSGDVTTACTVAPTARGRGVVVAREPLVVAGIEVAVEVFRTLEPALSIQAPVEDGTAVAAGSVLIAIQGRLAPMLTAERTALNFLQHLSGIATLTRAFVDRVAGTGAAILDTRKTTPGLRSLEKAAVRAGGGRNHRFGLDDGILIKDNHIAAAGGISAAVAAARQRRPHLLRIQVEVESLEELEEALAAGVDAVLLDNMPPSLLAAAVARAKGQVLLEASGGIDLENVREIAATGVDCISVGRLTHSARAIDISMEMTLEAN